MPPLPQVLHEVTGTAREDYEALLWRKGSFIPSANKNVLNAYPMHNKQNSALTELTF